MKISKFSTFNHYSTFIISDMFTGYITTEIFNYLNIEYIHNQLIIAIIILRLRFLGILQTTQTWAELPSWVQVKLHSCLKIGWMWEHTRDHHDSVVGDKGGMEDYKVRVTKKFKRCLERQVDEYIKMQHCEMNGGTVLSRNEFFTPKSVQPVFRQL